MQPSCSMILNSKLVQLLASLQVSSARFDQRAMWSKARITCGFPPRMDALHIGASNAEDSNRTLSVCYGTQQECPGRSHNLRCSISSAQKATWFLAGFQPLETMTRDC